MRWGGIATALLTLALAASPAVSQEREPLRDEQYWPQRYAAFREMPFRFRHLDSRRLRRFDDQDATRRRALEVRVDRLARRAMERYADRDLTQEHRDLTLQRVIPVLRTVKGAAWVGGDQYQRHLDQLRQAERDLDRWTREGR